MKIYLQVDSEGYILSKRFICNPQNTWTASLQLNDYSIKNLQKYLNSFDRSYTQMGVFVSVFDCSGINVAKLFCKYKGKRNWKRISKKQFDKLTLLTKLKGV